MMKATKQEFVTYDLTGLTRVEMKAVLSALTYCKNNHKSFCVETIASVDVARIAIKEVLC